MSKIFQWLAIPCMIALFAISTGCTRSSENEGQKSGSGRRVEQKKQTREPIQRGCSRCGTR